LIQNQFTYSKLKNAVTFADPLESTIFRNNLPKVLKNYYCQCFTLC